MTKSVKVETKMKEKIMKKVYFFLMYYSDGNLVDNCWQSENFNSIEEAFESKKGYSCKTSPIMEGWIKE